MCSAPAIDYFVEPRRLSVMTAPHGFLPLQVSSQNRNDRHDRKIRAASEPHTCLSTTIQRHQLRAGRGYPFHSRSLCAHLGRTVKLAVRLWVELEDDNSKDIVRARTVTTDIAFGLQLEIPCECVHPGVKCGIMTPPLIAISSPTDVTAGSLLPRYSA